MEDQEIQTLLEKYRLGTASEPEKALLEDWYLQRDIHAVSELSPLEFSEDLELIGKGLPLQRLVRKINWLPRIAAAAAMLAIFLTVFLEWPDMMHRPHPDQLATLTVPAGQKKQIILADGSRIWVNSGSQFKYPEAFRGKTREVFLSGEAYFDIRHHDHQPFIIHTGRVITTVLGTAFNIKEDKTRHTVEVTVTRGKVSVASGGKLLGIITPDRQLSFNMDNKKAIEQPVDVNRVVAWQKIDLRFEDVSFADAASALEKRFHVKISFSNARLKNCRFTGATLNGEKLDDVLKTICDFNHAAYQREPDRSIIISGPGCDN